LEKVNLAAEITEAIINHATRENPNECCGIIAVNGIGNFELYEVTNIEQSPFRYNMDPKEFFDIYQLLEGKGCDIWGFYHSHTHTEAYPSQTDRNLAAWSDSYYVIASLQDESQPVVRCFSILEGEVTEKQLNLIDESKK
jgi:proteasome lid subunit RPN8/RPN11